MTYSSIVFFSVISLLLNFGVFLMDYLPNRRIYSLSGQKSMANIFTQSVQTTILEVNLFLLLVGINKGMDVQFVPFYWLFRKMCVFLLTLVVMFQLFGFENLK